MRYQILNYVNTHDKCEMNEIIKHCHTNAECKAFAKEFINLYENKLIDCVNHWNFSSKNFYNAGLYFPNKWFVTDKGKKSIIKRNKKLKKRKNKTLDKLNKV